MLYMPREEGQGLVEYALILVLVAVVVIVILALLGRPSATSSATSLRRCSSVYSWSHHRWPRLKAGLLFCPRLVLIS
jgi:pilus assembly protein Flp/PilA